MTPSVEASGPIAGRPTSRALTATVAALAAIVALIVIVSRASSDCRELTYLLTFAGDNERLDSGLTAFGCNGVTEREANLALIVGIVAVGLVAGLLTRLLSYWWPLGWRSAPFRHWTSVDVVPKLSGVLLLISLACALVAVGSGVGGEVTLQGAWALFSTVFAWLGATLLLASGLLFIATFLGALGSRNTPYPSELEPGTEVREDQPPAGFGVCVSGGGIRAGSVAIGALWQLEQTGRSVDNIDEHVSSLLEEYEIGLREGRGDDDEIAAQVARERAALLEEPKHQSLLQSAKYLASVSGGGYAAVAWRIARGVRPNDPDPEIWGSGIFGPLTDDDHAILPEDATQENGGPPREFAQAFDDKIAARDDQNLREHMLLRRRFLLTGHGGLLLSILLILFGIVVQMALIATAVFLVSWPLGRLSRSWAVTSDQSVLAYHVELRHWMPSLLLVGIAVVLAVRMVGQWNTVGRRSLEKLIGALFGVAAALAFLLIAIPLAVRELEAVGLAAVTVAASALLGGTVGAIVTPVITARLTPSLTRLGGLFLAALLFVGALLIAREAAADGGWFAGSNWGLGYLAIAAVFVVACSTLDPRWWSLHTVYRHRLRGAFAVTAERERAAPGHPWLDTTASVFPVSAALEPQLDAYGSANGPEPLICASAARNTRTGTGVSALSFVFSPQQISFYDFTRTPGTDQRHVTEYACQTSEFLRFLSNERPADRPETRSGWKARKFWQNRRQALGTMSTAMAISGAAVTSSMGRSSLGSTDSLLAALNVRLGVWLPNPRYVRDGEQAKPSRLNYLLKEIFSWYDTEEPFLYVTDGGHRENLGLVELVRRRCKTILCVDASGDAPGSFSTLLQAVRLASSETGATIDIDSDVLNELRPNGPDLPKTCVAKVTINYPNEETGTLLYARALVDSCDPELRSFAEEDPRFPTYSTANQFLTPIQVRMLVRLGRSMARQCIQIGRTEIVEATRVE